MFFLRSLWQAWALAHSPAQHVNKTSPAVQHFWFGWCWGLGRFPYGGGGGRVNQWEAGIWSCDLRTNERPEKNCMGRGQTERYIHKLTSRLLERIGLRADALKKQSLVTRLESLEKEESLFLSASNLSHILASNWVNRYMTPTWPPGQPPVCCTGHSAGCCTGHSAGCCTCHQQAVLASSPHNYCPGTMALAQHSSSGSTTHSCPSQWVNTDSGEWCHWWVCSWSRQQYMWVKPSDRRKCTWFWGKLYFFLE